MNPYRQGTVRKSIFLWLDWLAKEQDPAMMDVTHVFQAFNITRKQAQELLDQWQQARQEVTE